MSSAIQPQAGARDGSGFFTDPTGVAQRRYEALRAYFVEGATAAEVAARFGYTTSSMQAMVRDFRAGDTDFFIQRRPGPRVAPAKQAARDEVVRLRMRGLSVTDIADALATSDTPRRSAPREAARLAHAAGEFRGRPCRGAAAGRRVGRA